MKKKVIFIIALSFMIFFGISIKGVAAMLPSNIEIDGNFYKFIYTEYNSHEYLKYLNMKPGDYVEKPLVVTNNTKYPFKVYLRSERESKIEPYDLSKKLDLTLSYNNKLIYEGTVLGNIMKKGIFLGTVNPGQRKIMNAKVILNPNTTNEYADKSLEIKWIFTAVGDHGDTISSSSGPNNTISGNDFSSTGSKNNVIRNIAKKFGINIPATGFTGMYQYGIPLIILGAVLYAVGRAKKKRREECE